MKKYKQHVYVLIASLALIGSGIFLYRHFVLDVPLKDTATVVNWMVEANLKFTAKPNQPIKASFTIPHMPPDYAILDEYFVSHQYGVTTSLEDLNREVHWSIRRNHGPQSLYYRAILKPTNTETLKLPAPSPVKPLEATEAQVPALKAIMNLSRDTSADIITYAQSVLKHLNTKDGNAQLLLNGPIDDLNLVKAAMLVLSQSKIAVMPVHMLQLKAQRHGSLKWFLLVYNEEKWIFMDPHTGATGLPHQMLVWQYGLDEMYTLKGGLHPSFTLTTSPAPMNALSIAKMRGIQTDSDLLRFSLLQLPVSAQETYKVLLTVPVGAFIILLLRNFIGLKTFGTFMPVLIALAFRETHVVWGVSLFTVIIAIGLLIRFYLAQLHLLLVPRLSAILTIVIMLMMGISVVSQSLGFDQGLSVALFPMVILTMTIERMCIVWDERGASDSLKSGFGSLLAAVIAYSAMNNPNLQYLLFAFPELLLVLLALILLFGQYRGYRLMELLRFRAMVE